MQGYGRSESNVMRNMALREDLLDWLLIGEQWIIDTGSIEQAARTLASVTVIPRELNYLAAVWNHKIESNFL